MKPHSKYFHTMGPKWKLSANLMQHRSHWLTVTQKNASRELIAKRYPKHGIIGEEFGQDRPDAEFVWVLDPVDGTKSFISGVPLFATLIALMHGRPVIGAINQPVLKQLVIGDGERTTLNGKARQWPTCLPTGTSDSVHHRPDSPNPMAKQCTMV